MKLLVHIEQYDVVGILPSQLESLTLLNKAMGVTRAAYVDNTMDGCFGISEFIRFKSLKEFLATEEGPFVAFSPDLGEDIRTVDLPSDAWFVFGPSMGYTQEAFGDIDVTWVKIPGGVLNSRDAVPIVLWEKSLWQEQ